jgi:hypothetical protein
VFACHDKKFTVLTLKSFGGAKRQYFYDIQFSFSPLSSLLLTEKDIDYRMSDCNGSDFDNFINSLPNEFVRSDIGCSSLKALTAISTN